MGCCGEVECEILNDDFARTSLETLTFSSQSAHSSGYGYDVTMTSTPTSCSVGDTLSGTSQLDYQEYSYYVKAVSSDTVSIEFLFVETPDESLDPDPETQGIETFTVKRLGTNYVGSDSSQPANYLWGVCSFGLVKSDDTGEHGDVTWLEIVPLYQKPNVIISIEQKEVNTSESTSLNSTQLRTMAGTEALAASSKGYNGFSVREYTTILHTYLSPKYEQTVDVDPNPWEKTDESAFNNDTNNSLDKSVCVTDNLIKVQYCQKQLERNVGSLPRPTEYMSNLDRYVTMTLKIGEPLSPSLITMMTGWDKAVTGDNGEYIGDRAYLRAINRKQVLSKLTIQHNDVGESKCKGCFTELELNCDKLKNEYAFVNMESRGAAQTLIDLGLHGSSVWSVSGDKLVLDGFSSGSRTTYPNGFCNALFPKRLNNFPPERQGFRARFFYGFRTPDFIGESHGMYTAIKVKLTANNSKVYYGYGIKVDEFGTGYVDHGDKVTGESNWLADARIQLNKTYEMGICVTPITGTDVSVAAVWSEYREVAWIRDDAGSFII
jgi:hypothetical protein